MKKILKKILPRSVRNLRHLFYAWWGAVRYHHPSEELRVIGVTGTSGKSTTVWLLRQLLEQVGYTVGSLSTIDFYIAGEGILNDKKMTMLGKMAIQKYLRKMVDKQCDIAIIETTSEGRLQHRHQYINYDTMLFTNLYPEHIESHGSFEKYRQAKRDILAYSATSKRKRLDGARIPKIAIVNAEAEEASGIASMPFDKKILFGKATSYEAKDVEMTKDGLQFLVDGRSFGAEMYGKHNVSNILGVIATARSLEIPWEKIEASVRSFRGVPGRIEFIPEAEEDDGFRVIVDYAFEPKAIAGLYEVVALLKPRKIIHVFGSTGGGRDVSRRFSVGEFVGQHADICIVTDEDPYDDDPMRIIEDVASAVAGTGKKEGETLYKILDRKKAIARAVSMAEEGDLVLITGKGSEQAMCVSGGKKIPWDDREIARGALRRRKMA